MTLPMRLIGLARSCPGWHNVAEKRIRYSLYMSPGGISEIADLAKQRHESQSDTHRALLCYALQRNVVLPFSFQ
jgi:hypothetical protein